MQLIDTHCHCDFSEFDTDREHVLQHCQQLGLLALIVPATQASGWDHLLSICAQYNELYPALGLHPMFSEQHKDSDIDLLSDYITRFQPLAVGEVGLDFYHSSADSERQIELLEQQLRLAQAARLPVIMHVRKAHEQVLGLLKKYQLCGGIIHAFNGSLQQAERYIDMGFKLGFGGTLTYSNASKIHHLAKTLSIDDMVLETDAPDMSPSMHKGERNSPEYLLEILQALAILRDEAPELIAKATTRNACKVFNITTVCYDS